MASIPDPILDKLRCYKCSNFLSCKPITITSDGQSLCGRCRPDQPVITAHTYECVADYFLFPCKNWSKHCAYLLNLKDVMDHEKNCKFGNTCSMMCSNPGTLFKPDSKLDLSQSLKFFNAPEQEILNTLTCTLCGYYLSSRPIHVNAEGMSICYRCYKTKDCKVPVNYIRHLALENILEILLFPCIYRRRGCTKVFKFGFDTEHESGCSYSKTQKPLKTFTDPSNGKQKGVIETHTGHMYGTITPNSQFFVAQNKITSDNYRTIEPIKVVPNEKQEKFFNQLIKHRESLQYQWHRNSRPDSSNSPPKTPNETGIENYRPNVRNDTNVNVVKQNSFRNDDGEDRYSLSPDPNNDTLESRYSFRNGNVSPSRVAKTNSSGSDTVDSPRSTISSHLGWNRSPLKLNPNDLLYSTSFSYPERQDTNPQTHRTQSFNDNGTEIRSPRVQHNPSFNF